MTYPEDNDQPKYMHLQGKTQYEMAQSIDAAFAAAERSVQAQSEQTALQWWYQQLEILVQEEFNLPDTALPKGEVSTQALFLETSATLLNQAFAVSRNGQPVMTLTIKRLLQRSLLDALDMMRAQQIWRFDLQRTLQTLQGRILHECQLPHRAP